MNSAHLKAVSSQVTEIPFQDTSMDIWDKKYRLKSKDGVAVDQDMDATYKRVARALADVEDTPQKIEEWHEHFLWALRRGAIPAGRIISNAGAQEHKPATSTINCTVSGIVRDSMNDILGKVHEAGLTLKAGCGIGYEFSTLRPRVLMFPVPGPTRLVHYPSWIYTTRCVLPFPLPVAGVVLRWLPLMWGIRM